MLMVLEYENKHNTQYSVGKKSCSAENWKDFFFLLLSWIIKVTYMYIYICNTMYSIISRSKHKWNCYSNKRFFDHRRVWSETITTDKYMKQTWLNITYYNILQNITTYYTPSMLNRSFPLFYSSGFSCTFPVNYTTALWPQNNLKSLWSNHLNEAVWVTIIGLAGWTAL